VGCRWFFAVFARLRSIDCLIIGGEKTDPLEELVVGFFFRTSDWETSLHITLIQSQAALASQNVFFRQLRPAEKGFVILLPFKPIAVRIPTLRRLQSGRSQSIRKSLKSVVLVDVGAQFAATLASNPTFSATWVPPCG
jgi:hypothetical protein